LQAGHRASEIQADASMAIRVVGPLKRVQAVRQISTK
jgi:hypothetical protein